jgi:predicted transcriptional regulator
MTRKLDKEHLEEIQTLRDAFTKNSTILGNLTIEQHVIEQQLEQIKQEKENLLNAFAQLQQQESELIDKMRERYGDGQINIADGTFTSNQ